MDGFGNFGGKFFDLNSMFNERAGPREAAWFWDRRGSSRASTNTPDYAQATNLYPHMARQDDAAYRYRPTNATIIPVKHVVSSVPRVDSPCSSSSSLDRSSVQGSTTPSWAQHQAQTNFGWPPADFQSPSSTIRSGRDGPSYASSVMSSGSSVGPMAYQSSGLEARSPTDSTASSSGKADTEAEVDALTSQLMRSMEPKMAMAGQSGSPSLSTPGAGFKKTATSFGVLKPLGNRGKTSPQQLATAANTIDLECFRCRRRFPGTASTTGGGIRVAALNTSFHTSCFTCYRCATPLNQEAFFHAQNRLLCPRCVTEALESCASCDRPITERLVRMLGRPYHPKCFTCSVCQCGLFGKPFTVDVHNRIHCLEDYHKRYAPRCTACGRPITPQPGGKQETKRVVANDASYHLECYGMRSH